MRLTLELPGGARRDCWAEDGATLGSILEDLGLAGAWEDRPLVTGVFYDGRQPPPWFSNAGRLPANKTLSGIRTKEHFGSQYNELLFDDTPGEVRTKLSSEHGKTQLNQGYLIHPRTDGQGAPRGEGFELRTDKTGALRAAEGLLLTAHERPDAHGGQLDRAEIVAQLEQALAIAKELSQHAQTHHADDTQTEEQARLLRDVTQWEDGSNTAPDAPVQSNKALLAATAPDGIAISSETSITVAAGGNHDLVAAGDSNTSVGQRLRLRIGEAFSLFVQKLGMKLIAAAGKIQIQAQSDEIEIGAAKKPHLYSLEEIVLEAPRISLRAQNAGVDYGENITSRTTGTHTRHAASHPDTGPASVSMQLPGMPRSGMKTLEQFALASRFGQAQQDRPHEIEDDRNKVESAVPRTAAARPARASAKGLRR
jgi:type VI secretion system secreted protein VgrG